MTPLLQKLGLWPLGRRAYFWRVLAWFAFCNLLVRGLGFALSGTYEGSWPSLHAAGWPPGWSLLAGGHFLFTAGAWGLTLLRLRDAGLPRSWSLLVWIPGVSLVAIAVFSTCPSDGTDTTPSTRARWLPASPMGAGLAGVLAGALFALLAAALNAIFPSYASPLFIGAPFVMGLVAAWVQGVASPPPTLFRSLLPALLCVPLACLLILACALEGVLCLAMALPLGIPLALIGGLFGHLLARRHAPSAGLAVSILLPLPMLLMAPASLPPSPIREVRTSLAIPRPPEVVWRSLVDQGALPTPRAWYFKAGIGYPTSVRIDAPRVGAIRVCEFSTGTVLEKITSYEPGHCLAFEITQQGPLMRELSPYDIHPAHLDQGFVRSLSGEFHLSPLPGGGTLLESRSRYACSYDPLPYWQMWVDGIVHAVHRRVLEHVKDQAMGSPS